MSYARLTSASSANIAHPSTSLGDILERVLDQGLVIAGDIRVNLLDIELLTIKLRLVVASLETARQVGINWWETDPWFNGDSARLEAENEKLRKELRQLKSSSDSDDSRRESDDDRQREHA
ncbi:gas vesicle protein GvpA/GvpJ/GvpM family [Stackebrandtia endophytica]|uniref:Gas vesicle protein GvpA/GvpJ/GvpM family n=1 Tax=Stackebrandtia endophytica TaxID=1496996 RepID=A0A543B1X1_9ACTN|nr:gas vesicle protein [Stackebrandtia endophytica]TQL78816.1 gas vesicle protein GvpA/GvpJ/GvpM family [Stackebrandtia endophytica]